MEAPFDGENPHAFSPANTGVRQWRLTLGCSSPATRRGPPAAWGLPNRLAQRSNATGLRARQDTLMKEGANLEANGLSAVTDWLEGLAETHPLTRQARSVVRTLVANQRLASYSSIREIANVANVSIGTVTRTAQALGFAGWPALQEELRALYLSSLSATEVAAHRTGTQDRPSYASITRDRDNLNTLVKSIDLDQLVRVAGMIAAANRTFIVATGSFNGIGQILAHTGWLHGYDVRLLSEEAQVVNTIANAREDDLVIVISFWRLYESSFQAIQSCHEAGRQVVLLTETVTREIEEQCTECIRVPSEGTGFAPSLTSATAVIHGIVAELIALNPERATELLRNAEREWERFQLMHRYSS